MVASNNNLRQDVDKTRGGIGAGGGGGGWGRQGLRKGPWTTAEDAILMEYVRKHGEGNWNAVQRNCGLLRCGKSCRLRWANHLRPNLKKGSFTPDEERFIIKLHSKIGNKWAKMASQLPGRTDNEIKNYWNTRVKRLQRAGLPIYPDDNPHYQNKHPSDQVQPQKTNPNSQTQYSNHKFNPSFSLLNPVLSFPTMVTYPPFLSHPNHSYQNFLNRGNLSNLPLPSSSGISTFSSPQSSILDNNFHMAGSLSQCNGLLNGPEKAELPSIQVQTRVKLAGTPASSVTSSGGDYMIGRQSEAAQHPFCTLIDSNEIETVMENSGLLETLLEESNALVQALNFKKETCFDAGQGKEDASNTGGADSISHHSSCGGKEEALIEVMNSMDDDLSSLLKNFPLSVPVPDWYDASSTATSAVTVTTSNGQSSNIVNKIPNSGLHENETTSINNPKRSTSLDSCCCSWNNMPGIC